MKGQSSSDLGRSCTGFSARPTESALCVTQRAIIQESVQRQQHLVAILAVGFPQVTEIDQPIDKRFGQVVDMGDVVNERSVCARLKSICDFRKITRRLLLFRLGQRPREFVECFELHIRQIHE